MLAQTFSAGTAASDVQSQVLGIAIPILIGIIVVAGGIIKAWAESKLASMKAQKALAEAALIEAEAKAEIMKLEAEKAKADAKKQKTITNAIIEGVESIPNPDIRKLTKDAIAAFSENTGKATLIDAAVEALGLKKSKSDIKSPDDK